MARSYLPVDREQGFLLPPDVREWLPEGHLAWFVIDVVARVDTSGLHALHPLDGVGRRAYDPDMLLGLLVYAYCTGQRWSRRIEQLCEVDVASRVIAANWVPDHTTIARFRQQHEQVAASLFVDVLELCATAGMATVGVVAVDGTKVAANASMRANRTREQLEAEVSAMFAEADATDAAEDEQFGDRRGDELAEEFGDRRRRGVRLDAALAELRDREARRARDVEERRDERAAREAAAAAHGEGMRGGRPRGTDRVAAARATYERVKRRAEARRAEIEARATVRGRKPSGPPPTEPNAVRRARERYETERTRGATTTSTSADAKPERVNVTDPDSRLMKSAHGWLQGYNAQAAVNEHGVVVAAYVTQDGNDVNQCAAMITATQANLALGLGHRSAQCSSTPATAAKRTSIRNRHRDPIG